MVALLRMPERQTPAQCAAERRLFPRKEFKAMVQGHRMDNTLPARQQPELTLHLRDLSLGGLSAISAVPLAGGERLTVFFPQNGPLRGWDAYGRVIRCDESSMGYRVAVEFDPLPAA